MLLGIFLCFSGTVLGGGRPKIVVHPVSWVSGPEIYLGEIAQFSDMDTPMVALMSEISLGNSPRPGKLKSFSQRQFSSRLRSRVPILGDLEIKIPDRISIKRVSQTIPRSQVMAALDLYLAEAYAPGTYELSNLRIRHSRAYPEGEVVLTVVRPKSRVDRNGRLSFILNVSVDDRPTGQIRVAGRLIHWVDLLCAKRDIKPGETIASDDVYVSKRDSFSIRGQALDHPKSLVGKVASSFISKDAYIDGKRLKALPLVEKGQLITLVARNDSIRIVTSGISKEDGCLDEIIRVENLRSGKLVRGRVKDAARVEVIY